MAPDACIKTSGRWKTILQRECRVGIGIEKSVRDGVKVLANAVSANTVTMGRRLVEQ